MDSTDLGERRWSAEELEHELRRFEAELRRAELRDSSVATYVGRSSIFIRWLKGDYQPRGPIKQAQYCTVRSRLLHDVISAPGCSRNIRDLTVLRGGGRARPRPVERGSVASVA